MRRLFLALLGVAALGGEAVAQPLTSHPRMWLTQSDLPRLRSWATAGNPMYQNGLLAAATAAKAHADASWNWSTGLPNANWHDAGATNWEADATEAYAQFFGFMSLVDPNPAARAQWAMRGRTLLMWALKQVAQGPLAGAPFRDPGLPTGNRGNAWGEAWGLAVDWLYPMLTAADKVTIQKAFLVWANEIATVPNRAGQSPLYPGSVNDPRLLGNDTTLDSFTRQNHQLQLRWAANNYSLGEMRFLTHLAIALDPADDKPVNPSQPTTQLGNTVGSYISQVIGNQLYQTYAMFETLAVAAANLHLTGPNISLGLASGGLPVEGSLYGESLGFLAETLLALTTAGYTSTTQYGPQVGFLSRPFWDQSVSGLLQLTAPQSYVPASASYMGAIYPVATYGDNLRTWLDPYGIGLVAPLALADQRTHNAKRLNAIRWITANLLEGGGAGLYNRASNIWGNSTASYGIFYYMMFDPAAAPAADPRPAQPLSFTAPAIGSVLARSNWTPNASWFSYRCSWESINHEGGDCGQFQFYRKGQWLTKEWTNYALDWYGYTSAYHNTLSLKNANATLGAGSIFTAALATGSQWTNGGNNGDPSSVVSANNAWAYATSDMTNLYNHPDWYTASNNAKDVTSAVRSIVWLNPDNIVVYDRASSAGASEFKRFNLVLMNAPTITGHKATATAGGQTLTVQSLMPATATISEQHKWTTDPSQEIYQVALLDPSYDRLVIEDPSNPQTVRFLTVLTGTDSGIAAPSATVIHSSSGDAYDGAIAGNTAVLFPVTWGQGFNGFSYNVTGGVKRHLITGLTPGAGYNVTISAGGTGITVTSGSTYTADVGGVVAVGFAASLGVSSGGSVVGTALSGPATGGGGGGGSGGGSGGGGAGDGGSGGGTNGGQGAPTALQTDGAYYYDYTEGRVFWQQNGHWQVINDGNTQTYTPTATGYQGPGAPEQLIADGASYLDTVENRSYVQQSGVWILILPSA